MQVDIKNGKACMAENIMVNKDNMSGFATIVCNSKGNKKKVAYVDKCWPIKQGEAKGVYGVSAVYIPVEEGDYIISYEYNRLCNWIIIQKIIKKHIVNMYSVYVEMETIFEKNIINVKSIDMEDINNYSRFGELANAVRIAYKKSHDYKYEMKPFCIMSL